MNNIIKFSSLSTPYSLAQTAHMSVISPFSLIKTLAFGALLFSGGARAENVRTLNCKLVEDLYKDSLGERYELEDTLHKAMGAGQKAFCWEAGTKNFAGSTLNPDTYLGWNLNPTLIHDKSGPFNGLVNLKLEIPPKSLPLIPSSIVPYLSDLLTIEGQINKGVLTQGKITSLQKGLFDVEYSIEGTFMNDQLTIGTKKLTLSPLGLFTLSSAIDEGKFGKYQRDGGSYLIEGTSRTNSVIRKGTFNQNGLHGQGSFTNADHTVKGIFEDDVLVKPEQQIDLLGNKYFYQNNAWKQCTVLMQYRSECTED